MPVTLQTIRRDIALELGQYELLTVTTTSTGPDAKRTVICDSLIDDEIADSIYGQGWLYRPATSEQRRTRKAAIDGIVGSLTTTGEFSDVPLIDDEFEFHKRMPAVTAQARAGIREAINAGLSCWNIRDWIPITGVANQYSYNLFTLLPFLGAESRILGVYDPPLFSGGPPVATWRAWSLRHDGAAPQLDFTTSAYSTGELFYVEVWRSANTLIYDGSAWVNSTAGLVNDTDMVNVERNEARLLGLWKAYEYLAAEGGAASGSSASYTKKAAEYGAICQALKRDRQNELGGFAVTPQSAGGPMWAKNWAPG